MSEIDAVILGIANDPAIRSPVANISAFPEIARFTRQETIRSEYRRLGFVSSLLLLRLQSEALPT